MLSVLLILGQTLYDVGGRWDQTKLGNIGKRPGEITSIMIMEIFGSSGADAQHRNKWRRKIWKQLPADPGLPGKWPLIRYVWCRWTFYTKERLRIGAEPRRQNFQPCGFARQVFFPSLWSPPACCVGWYWRCRRRSYSGVVAPAATVCVESTASTYSWEPSTVMAQTNDTSSPAALTQTSTAATIRRFKTLDVMKARHVMFRPIFWEPYYSRQQEYSELLIKSLHWFIYTTWGVHPIWGVNKSLRRLDQ